MMISSYLLQNLNEGEILVLVIVSVVVLLLMASALIAFLHLKS